MCADAMLSKQTQIPNPVRPCTPALCREIDEWKRTLRLHCADSHSIRTSLLFLAPPPLEKAALAGCTASLAGWVPARLVVPPLAIALPARSATSSANAALNRAGSRPDSRAVVVRVCIGGAGAGCEECVRWRTGVTPGPCARVPSVRSRVSRSTGAGGVVADPVVDGGGAGGPCVEEVDGAAGGGAVGGTDDGEAVAEDVADVEVAGRVRFEDGAVGVGPAVAAHVGDADLAAEAGAEIGAAGCGTGVGAAIEGEVRVLGVAGPCDG